MHIVREFSRGFSGEDLHWVRAEHIPLPGMAASSSVQAVWATRW